MTPSAVKATITVTGLDEGVHVVNVSLTIPDNTLLVLVDPPQVAVVLRR
jgi:hypothetical protein